MTKFLAMAFPLTCALSLTLGSALADPTPVTLATVQSGDAKPMKFSSLYAVLSSDGTKVSAYGTQKMLCDRPANYFVVAKEKAAGLLKSTGLNIYLTETRHAAPCVIMSLPVRRTILFGTFPANGQKTEVSLWGMPLPLYTDAAVPASMSAEIKTAEPATPAQDMEFTGYTVDAVLTPGTEDFSAKPVLKVTATKTIENGDSCQFPSEVYTWKGPLAVGGQFKGRKTYRVIQPSPLTGQATIPCTPIPEKSFTVSYDLVEDAFSAESEIPTSLVLFGTPETHVVK